MRDSAGARLHCNHSPMAYYYREDCSLGGEFGFAVGIEELAELDRQEYFVQLPHQCDAWEITEEAPDRATAVRRMEAFIAEAQAALAKLRELPERTHHSAGSSRHSHHGAVHPSS